MDLNTYRTRIDAIDQNLVSLFIQRMHLSAQIAAYKKENCLPIHIPAREQFVLESVCTQSGPEMAEYVQSLYSTIFELSRAYQHACSLESNTEVI